MWQLLSSSVLFCKIIISYGGRLGRGDLRLIVDFSQLKVVLASVLCGHTSPRGFDYSASFPSSGPTMRSKGHSALHSPHNQYLEHKLQFGILASTCCEMQALHGSTNMYILYICCTQCLHVIFSDLYLFAVSNRDTLYPENRQALNLSFPKRRWGGGKCVPPSLEGLRESGVEGQSTTIGSQQLVTMASRDPLQWAGLMQLPLPLRWRFSQGIGYLRKEPRTSYIGIG